MSNFDVLVVGGGHAGLEAAVVSAKMGVKTHLLTLLIDNIALASCNPAIGGLGKGHLVKELDALGGVMGEITDKCGLQYKTLNASKGPAVRGTRAQIDMDLYRITARNIALNQSNLSVSQEMVDSLIIENGKILGVKTNVGKSYFAKCVILTTGTFMRGLIHIGETKIRSGRFGENASYDLSQSLQDFGFKLERLKTGTCPRIKGASIDFSELEKHHGDENPPHFSYRTKDFSPTQIPCFLTYTNEKTHQIIQANINRAPMFIGEIEGVGPRYCPSIEDKIYRFADKNRHQLFIEPQTKDCSEYYINGLSTSLPYDVQEEIIKSIKGLQTAEISRFGYAIEYDFINPTALKHSLETKNIENLFFAGQINGTTGYEEAAAQGLIAGINAALRIKGHGEFTLSRSEAYIGVMIDDLVTKGTNEPYRLFTSRAEYRLLLREDNAIFRLYKYAKNFGLMSDLDFQEVQKDSDDINFGLNMLQNMTLNPNKQTLNLLESLGQAPIISPTQGCVIAAKDNLSDYAFDVLFPELAHFSKRAKEQIKILSKYQSYIQKQSIQIEAMDSALSIEIPQDLDFNISGLSLEVIEKLKKFNPKNLFEASKISGMTPSALDILHIYIHLHNRKKA